MSMLKEKQRFTLTIISILCLEVMSLAVLGLAVLAAVPERSEAAVQGEAAGSLSIDGKSVKLGNVYAMDQPNTFEKKKSDIAVLITENPLPDEAFRDLEDLLDAANGIKGSAWVFFKINDEQKTIFEAIDHPTLGESRLMMSGFTRAEFVKKVLTGKNIEGTFRTNRKEEIMGHTYELDVKVKAEITRAKRPEPLPDAKTGKALPANGGEPFKAYKAFHSALMKMDVASFRKLAPDPRMKDVSDKEIADGMEFMALMTPKVPTLSKGFVSKAGDRAVLYVTGTVDKEKTYGTVEMIKHAGTWQLGKQSWSNTPPK